GGRAVHGHVAVGPMGSDRLQHAAVAFRLLYPGDDLGQRARVEDQGNEPAFGAGPVLEQPIRRLDAERAIAGAWHGDPPAPSQPVIVFCENKIANRVVLARPTRRLARLAFAESPPSAIISWLAGFANSAASVGVSPRRPPPPREGRGANPPPTPPRYRR